MRSLKRKRNKNPVGKIGNVFYFISFYKLCPEEYKKKQRQQKNTVDMQTKY